MSRYPIPIEITYDQGKEFIGHELRKYPIEMEYGITAKPITSGNHISNAVLERNNHFLGNLVQTCTITQSCVEKYDPWSGILAAASFSIHSTKHNMKGYSPVQLIFGRDMILPIKHTVD